VVTKRVAKSNRKMRVFLKPKRCKLYAFGNKPLAVGLVIPDAGDARYGFAAIEPATAFENLPRMAPLASNGWFVSTTQASEVSGSAQ
jgi:hypothetical protein